MNAFFAFASNSSFVLPDTTKVVGAKLNVTDFKIINSNSECFSVNISYVWCDFTHKVAAKGSISLPEITCF
jgi:hypothetical protein